MPRLFATRLTPGHRGSLLTLPVGGGLLISRLRQGTRIGVLPCFAQRQRERQGRPRRTASPLRQLVADDGLPRRPRPHADGAVNSPVRPLRVIPAGALVQAVTDAAQSDA